MSVESILRRADELGIALKVAGERIQYRPKSVAPPDFVEELRRHKPEVVEHLRQAELERLRDRYRQAFPGEGPVEHELAELERRVHEVGVCLAWCEEMQDFVGFIRDDVDPASVPAGFVVYFERELEHIAGLSPIGLQRVHAAKKTGAIVTGSEPDSEAEA